MTGLVLIVGGGSFLAREFATLYPEFPARFIGHGKIDDPFVYEGVSTIVNFAFAPEMYSQDYDRSLGIDLSIAKHAMRHGIHYVMISSRKVYQQDAQWDAQEDSPVFGMDFYGRNKLRIERNLKEILGDRLTILRPSNIIGFETIPGRQRMGAFLLNQLAQTERIHISLSPFVRRDIVPVNYFCAVLRKILQKRPSGIYNVGAGEATEIGQVALWMIEGFGRGQLVVENSQVADEFQLNSTRLKEVTGLSCGRSEVARYCRDLGSRLAAKGDLSDR
jgi:dTDP-4-dehydrorhamnose reductase/UDP-glucose 4-epimerase